MGMMGCGAWQISQSLNRLIPIENWQLAYVGTYCAATVLPRSLRKDTHPDVI